MTIRLIRMACGEPLESTTAGPRTAIRGTFHDVTPNYVQRCCNITVPHLDILFLGRIQWQIGGETQFSIVTLAAIVPRREDYACV